MRSSLGATSIMLNLNRAYSTASMGIEETVGKSDSLVEEAKASPSKALLNDPMAIFPIPFGRKPVPSYDILWAYFKSSPELQGIFNAIVDDILSDGWHLEGGRNKKKQAEKYLKKIQFKQTLVSFLFDVLVTGDGYLYKVQPSETEMKSIVSSVAKSYYATKKLELKSDVLENISDMAFEELKYENPLIVAPREIIHLPSSTISIDYSAKGGVVHGYIQKVGMETVYYSPDEVIHWAPIRLDGQMYGFSNIQGSLIELETLASLKDYVRFVFDKGGVPQYMFTMEDETPDSPNYKNLKTHLAQFSVLNNKYKNLVLTGKVDAKELSTLNKDMEYGKLAKYLTQVIVMTWGIPASRLSDALVTEGVKTSVTSTQGYFRHISHWQDMLEDVINWGVLKPFDVMLEFNKTYKQDELMETQAYKTKCDVVEQLISLGLINKEFAFKYLQIDEEDQGTGKPKVVKTGLRKQGLLSNKETMAEAEQLAANKVKRDSASKL